MQDNINSVVKTKDGSNTLFSQKYNQHYHNPDDGAINESLSKHILPTFQYHKEKDELTILDICFGIGYNTFTTLLYVKNNNQSKKINIYSPELDGNLVSSLENFNFPKEFEEIKHIIKEVAINKKYEDENIKIEVNIGDAREYIKTLEKNSFDIIYQDAFSSEVNQELWTKEYFDDIYKLCKQDCVMSTYSVATPIRLSMNEAGFYIYEYRPVKRKITLASKIKKTILGKFIDMDLKRQRNKEAKAIYDKSNN
ncbi:tRNA (5-methylaminomethyl-2-thiouridine)(34)-methyltransferase MnmD [Poseidonibacter antarcticus]|uniref:tRNA (5-methylaminomethyl-2-thiouridine)(34)-methyltransferase MnmD n=1 Tax=Poseidonibacter antarcticus TaxID=2478538 RepID=UPI000EF4C5B7|nr:MnmC family methyltransferase [Poseidonibacter antarcticus]